MNPEQLHVFLEYSKRFEAIAQGFPISTREFASPADRALREQKESSSEHVQYALLRYFNLCSEEFYLQKVGLINDEVWTFWSTGMNSFLALPLFANAWRRVRDNYAPMPDFQQFLDKMLEK